jgi:hypothetical protein
VHRGAFDCQSLLDRDAGTAYWFYEPKESFDELDEVHSQL